MAEISVVIPACDRPPAFLAEAIASVQAQTLPALEIIVADNGRTSVERADIPDDVLLLRLPPRIGVSRARNLGAAEAKGQFLAFLDDDDTWTPTYLEEVMQVMQAEDADCAYGRMEFHADGEFVASRTPSGERFVADNIFRKNPGTGGSNVVIKTRVFQEIGGFDERLRTGEDKALALTLLATGKRISAAPLAVVTCRKHDGERLTKNMVSRWYLIWLYRRSVSPKVVFWLITQPYRRAKRALREKLKG